MNQYCTRYLQFLSLEKNASPNTLASYRLDITRYLRFLVSQNIRSIDGVSGENMAQFLVTLHEQGLSPRSVNRCFPHSRGSTSFSSETASPGAIPRMSSSLPSWAVRFQGS